MSKPTVNHFRCLGITLSVRIMDLFAACRNRETTEPGVFMLPAFWRFLKLFLYTSWQPSLAHAFFRGSEEKEDLGCGWAGEDAGRTLGLLSRLASVTTGFNFSLFKKKKMFEVHTLLLRWRWIWSRASQGVCMSAHERVLSLDLGDVFHAGLTSCYFCEVKTPAFMAFWFDRSSQGLCGVRAVFCRDLSDRREWRKFGELVDQNGNLSDWYSPAPPWMSKQVWICSEFKKIKKKMRSASKVPRGFPQWPVPDTEIMIRGLWQQVLRPDQHDARKAETSLWEQQRLEENIIPPGQKRVWLVNARACVRAC